MLTTNQLIKIFPKSERSNTVPDTEQVSNIMQNVAIESGMTDNGMDYYFRISLLDLSKALISEDVIFEMAKNGWVLSKDRKYIQFFY